MTVQLWQSLIYPALLVSSLVFAGAILLTWWTVERLPVLLAMVAYFIFEAITFALLTLTTGTNPQLDINLFRPLILWARSAMLLALWACIGMQLWRVWHRR